MIKNRTVVKKVCEKDIYYIISSVKDGYRIRVTADNESVSCFVCGDPLAIEALYEKICEGEVTPCTLENVIEDFYGSL